MLKKTDIIEQIKSLGLPVSGYWLVTGTAMVMHGIKLETKDIDMGCTTEVFEALIPKAARLRVDDDGSRSLELNEVVEVFENWNVDGIDMLDGIPTADIPSIIKHKQELGREKDRKDLEQIKTFLNKSNPNTQAYL